MGRIKKLPTVPHKQLIDEIKEITGFHKKVIDIVVDAYLLTLIQHLMSKENVKLKGIGKFHLTKTRITIYKGRRVVRPYNVVFNSSLAFKTELNNALKELEMKQKVKKSKEIALPEPEQIAEEILEKTDKETEE